MKIKVKYDEGHPRIKKLSVGDWHDLYTAEDAYICVGEYEEISLGVRMEIPEGYEAWLLPRSSTFKKFGLRQTNSMGIIDNSYAGNEDVWKMPVMYEPHKGFGFTDVTGKYHSRTCMTIPKHTRIAQFRIMKKQPEFEIVEVENMEKDSRGGFGSTGTK